MARVLSEWIGIPVSGAFDLAASARFLEGVHARRAHP
jgi:hypothetical protein